MASKYVSFDLINTYDSRFFMTSECLDSVCCCRLRIYYQLLASRHMSRDMSRDMFSLSLFKEFVIFEF